MTQIVCFRISDSGDEARKKLGAGQKGGGEMGEEKGCWCSRFLNSADTTFSEPGTGHDAKYPYSVVY